MTKGPKRELSSNSVSLDKNKNWREKFIFRSLRFYLVGTWDWLATYKNENLFEEIFDNYLKF